MLNRTLRGRPTLRRRVAVQRGHLLMTALACVWQVVAAATAYMDGEPGDLILGVLGIVSCLAAAALLLEGRLTDCAVRRLTVPAALLWQVGHLSDDVLMRGNIDLHTALMSVLLAVLAFNFWPFRRALAISVLSYALLVGGALVTRDVSLATLNAILFTMVLIGYMAFFGQQVLQAQQRARQAEGMIVRDDVTGLLTQQAAVAQLERVARDLASDSAHLALAVLAVEGLADINRRYGHGSGDRVLQMVSIVLVRQIGPQDIAARGEGAKFLLVFKNANRKEAEGRLAQMLATLNAEAWPGGPRMEVRAALGLLSETDSLDGLLTTVQERLQQLRATARMDGN